MLTMKRTAEEELKEVKRVQRQCYNSKDCLKETDCGIDCFLNDFCGLPSILKNLCEDFIVQEIDETGHPVELINTEKPEDIKKCTPTSDDSGIDRLKTILKDNETIISGINEFCKEIQTTPTLDKGFEINIILTKEERTTIHKIIRESFPFLLSDTNTSNNIVLYSRGNKDHLKRLARSGWMFKDKQYVKFTLKKKDIDTMTCLNILASKQHRKPNIYGFAGVKDKRAITYQKITGFKITPLDVYNVAKTIPQIEVGDFEFTNKELKIADSVGNKFTIVLRNVVPTATESQLNDIIDHINNRGYLNYYGLQRFGTGTSVNNTFIIGRDILISDWKGAVEKLFDGVYNRAFPRAYSTYMESKDVQKACKLLPFKFRNESEMLKALDRSDGSYSNAFAAIPIKKRTIYLHGLQSYFFNHFVSYRFTHFGDKVIPGDMVFSSNEQDKLENEDSYDLRPVHFITEDEVNSYTLSDIILPLPGTDTVMPEYIKQYYASLLESLSLPDTCWHHPIPLYNLKGAYRKMIYKPKNLEASLQRTENDLSIHLSFILGAGCYATMLIREITHLGTDRNTQLQYEQETNKDNKIIENETLSNDDNDDNNNNDE